MQISEIQRRSIMWSIGFFFSDQSVQGLNGLRHSYLVVSGNYDDPIAKFMDHCIAFKLGKVSIEGYCD